MASASPIFTTLGQTILDEIHHPALGILKDVIGGSGTYATLGARIAFGPSQADRIVFLLRVGSDFPSQVIDQLTSWDIVLPILESSSGTFRGALTYHDIHLNEKSFQYINPPSALIPSTLPRSVLEASIFHVGPPAVFSNQIAALLDTRQAAGISDRPLIVWEPSPSLCREGTLEDAIAQAEWADVISPNHIELAMLNGYKDFSDSTLTKQVLEDLGHKFLSLVRQKDGSYPLSSSNRRTSEVVIVVRVAERGSFTIQKSNDNHPTAVWFPAYHTDNSKVVDATGGGNAFLGGFSAEFGRTRNVYEACLAGSVAASFAIEQIGLPTLAVDAMDQETWNGETFGQRLGDLRERTALMNSR